MYSTFFKIAYASLRRRKSRTMMVITMIAACFWGMLTMEGVYDGMTEQVIENAIRSSSGHISMYASGYRQEMGLANTIESLDLVRKNLDRLDDVSSYSYRLIQDCLISTAHYSQNGVVQGINLKRERQHGRLDEFVDEGGYTFGEKANGIILGHKLAKKLKTGLGKKIILAAQDKNNEIASLAFKVTGILRTNNIAVDERSVFIDLETARKMLQLQNGATQFSIMLKEPKLLNVSLNALRNAFPQLDILSWGELYPALLQSRSMMKVFNLITSMIVFFVAGLGIFGVMLVSVLERLREFGIMMAIGTHFRQISTVVIIESFCMSLFGYLAGAMLGSATLAYFMNKGLDLTLFSEGMETFGLDSIIYAIIRPDYFITAFLAIFLASFTSVIYPLWVIRKSNPIETINKI